MQVSFEGPFSWLDSADAPSVFEHPTGQLYGVYLWTIPRDEGHLVYYVGETWRTFAERSKEHLKEYLAGMYDIFDFHKFQRGRKVVLWRGMYSRGEEVRVAEFVAQHESLWPHLLGMIKSMRFFLAPLELDKRMLQRIESAVIRLSV